MRPSDSPFKRGLLSPSFHPFLLSLSSFSTLYNQKRRHRSSDIIHRTKKEGEEEKYEHEWNGAPRPSEKTIKTSLFTLSGLSHISKCQTLSTDLQLGNILDISCE